MVDLRRLGSHRLAGHDTGSRQRRHGMAGERTTRESYRCFRRTIYKARCRASLLIAHTTERSAIESVWLESITTCGPKEFVDGSVIEKMNYPAASCWVSEGRAEDSFTGVTRKCFYRGSISGFAWIPA